MPDAALPLLVPCVWRVVLPMSSVKYRLLLLCELHGDLHTAVREDLPAAVSLAILIELGYALRRADPEHAVAARQTEEGGQALDAGEVAPLVAEYLHGAGEPAAVHVRDRLDRSPELREEHRRDAVVG